MLIRARVLFALPLAATLICGASGAWAQGAAPAPDKRPSIGQGDAQPPAGNPSERLDRSGGVITPNRDVDPKMEITPPDPGPTSTPVIPPPGTPGGNPNVVPK